MIGAINKYLENEKIQSLWKDPKKELPIDGQIVAVLYGHWKQNNPMSYQIMFGEVEESGTFVCSCDYTGNGNWGINLRENFKNDSELGLAWMNANDFILPEFIP